MFPAIEAYYMKIREKTNTFLEYSYVQIILLLITATTKPLQG